jgi:class 3 adenylate cyclase/CHASE2 domain-containing sensor protein
VGKEYKFKDFGYMVLIVIISIICVVVLPHILPFVQIMESWTRDARMAALTSPQEQSDDIVIVTITEDTLSTLAYRSPLDRDFLAQVLSALDATGARAIGLDILFDQPTEPAKDENLRHTILNLSTPLVTAIANQDSGLTQSQQAFLSTYTRGLKLGYANLVKDRNDGVVRWIYPGKEVKGNAIPGLAGAVHSALGGRPPTGTESLVYRAPPDSQTPAFRSYQAHLVSVLPKEWFRNRIVLIGADLPLEDRHRTPFAATQGTKGVLPGITIHAHALSQMMSNLKLHEPSHTHKIIYFIVLAALGMVIAVINFSLVIKTILFATFVVSYLLVSGLLWRNGGLMVPVVAPILALGISMGNGIAYFGQRDRKLKKFIREAFSLYLAPTLVERLIDDPSRLQVGGEQRELTYIFTDIANFTSLTEQCVPSQLVPLLNAYINAMTKIASDHGATLDKIIGDATVFFFNAPVDQPDHPAKAVACALAMDAFAQDFVRTHETEGLSVGITRIGVHTGTATIGNFGGDTFFDYTAFGDMVNTAARLESVNKHLGIRICVSEATASRCPDSTFRPVGVLVLKGKSVGIKVFEPLFPMRAIEPAVQAYIIAYQKMCDGEPTTEDAFRQVLDLDPDDPLAKLHLGRIKNNQKSDMIVMKEK